MWLRLQKSLQDAEHPFSLPLGLRLMELHSQSGHEKGKEPPPFAAKRHPEDTCRFSLKVSANKPTISRTAAQIWEWDQSGLMAPSVFPAHQSVMR